MEAHCSSKLVTPLGTFGTFTLTSVVFFNFIQFSSGLLWKKKQSPSNKIFYVVLKRKRLSTGILILGLTIIIKSKFQFQQPPFNFGSMKLNSNLSGSRKDALDTLAGVLRAMNPRNLPAFAQLESQEIDYITLKRYYANHEPDSELRNLSLLLRGTYDYVTLDHFEKRDTLSSLAVSAMKAGRITDSSTFRNKIMSLGLVPDVALYDILISICGKSKRSDDAIQLLDEMKRTELEPTEQTFICLLNACTSTGRSDQICNTILDMRQAGVRMNAFCYAGMITAHLNQTLRADDAGTKIIALVEQSKRRDQVNPKPIAIEQPKHGYPDYQKPIADVMMDIPEEELYNLPTADYVKRPSFLLNRRLPVYHAAFNALAELRDFQATNKLLGMLEKDGGFHDTYIRIQIMRCYLRVMDLDRGLKAFEDCRRLDVLDHGCADIYVALAEGAMFGYTPRGMQIAQETLVNMNKRKLVLDLKSGDDLLRIAAGEKTGGYTTANLIWDMMQAQKLVPSLPVVNAYYNGLRARDVPEDDLRLKLVAQTRDKVRLRLRYLMSIHDFLDRKDPEGLGSCI